MEPSQSNQPQTGSSSSSSEFRLRPETTVTAHYLAVVCRDLAHRRLHKGFFQWLRHDDLVNRELAQSIYAQAQTTAMDPQSDSVTGAGTRIRTFVDAAVQKDDESTHASTEEERSGAQSAGQSERLQTDSSASDNNSSDPSWFSPVEVYSENSEESWTNRSTRSTCTPSYTGSVLSNRTTSSMSSTTAEGVRLPRAPRVQGNMSEVVRRQHNFQANMSEVGRRQHNFQASPLRSMQPQICCR